MPKFEQTDIKGEGIIRLKTIKNGENFETTAEVDMKGVNTEGAIDQLRKIADKLYEEDLCSQGRKCEKCGKLIPNHFNNDLCWDCYNKVTEENKREEKLKEDKPVERSAKGEADFNPIK